MFKIISWGEIGSLYRMRVWFLAGDQTDEEIVRRLVVVAAKRHNRRINRNKNNVMVTSEYFSFDMRRAVLSMQRSGQKKNTWRYRDDSHKLHTEYEFNDHPEKYKWCCQEMPQHRHHINSNTSDWRNKKTKTTRAGANTYTTEARPSICDSSRGLM